MDKVTVRMLLSKVGLNYQTQMLLNSLQYRMDIKNLSICISL